MIARKGTNESTWSDVYCSYSNKLRNQLYRTSINQCNMNSDWFNCSSLLIIPLRFWKLQLIWLQWTSDLRNNHEQPWNPPRDRSTSGLELDYLYCGEPVMDLLDWIPFWYWFWFWFLLVFWANYIRDHKKICRESEEVACSLTFLKPFLSVRIKRLFESCSPRREYSIWVDSFRFLILIFNLNRWSCIKG